MKWHVKIWLSPVVQEEPEEFVSKNLSSAFEEIFGMIGSEKRLFAVREIRITKAPNAQDLP